VSSQESRGLSLVIWFVVLVAATVTAVVVL